MFELDNKVAVVTGASSGIGRDAALAYAMAGADVCMLARREERLQELQKEIEKLGRRALAIPCDVTEEESIKDAVEKIIDTFGRIDILLNNAGIAVSGGLEDTTVEEWDSSFSVNCRGQFLVSKYVVPHMIKQKYGKVVNMASVNAIIGDKHEQLYRLAYNSSKAGIVGLTTGMAAAYAKYGITVNAIGPGYFKTEMTDRMNKSFVFKARYNMLTPAGRAGENGELDGTILFLSSDASNYVQGQYICVDGGTSIV